MTTFKNHLISEAIEYHIAKDIPFAESIFRYGSEKYFEVINEVRKRYEEEGLELTPLDEDFLNSDIGEIVDIDGVDVPLDFPMIDEEETPELNKPKRGGPKKYYVYVRDPSTKNIKKVTWGDTTGLKVKIDDPGARKSFAARHRCHMQNDKTTAAYWACRLPYYAKSLGLSGGGNYFW